MDGHRAAAYRIPLTGPLTTNRNLSRTFAPSATGRDTFVTQTAAHYFGFSRAARSASLKLWMAVTRVGESST